jgi:hypothetical protein
MESLVIQEGSYTPSTSSGIDLHTSLSDKNTNYLWEAVLLLEIIRRYISSLWYRQWPVQVCNHEFYIYRLASLESWNIQVLRSDPSLQNYQNIPGQASNHVPMTTVSKRKESCECNHEDPFWAPAVSCEEILGPNMICMDPVVLPS